MNDLYRIPVDEPNYSKLLESPFRIADCEDAPPAFSDEKTVRFWGIRSGPNNERLYEQLATDDGLLFYLGKQYREADDGAYVGFGRVGQKVRCSPNFARQVLENEGARRLYTVKEFHRLGARPGDVDSLLGYSGHPQGPHRVRDDRYTSVDELFDRLAEISVESDRREKSPGAPANSLDEIVSNALYGTGPCDDCVAHSSGNSRLVNPGLSDPSGDIMFVTEEPKHEVDWDDEQGWFSWNERFMSGFETTDGGRYIRELLDPLDVSIHDVWIADSLKCPTEDHGRLGTENIDTEEAYEHCRSYLEEELRLVDPDLVVTLGNKASERILGLLGKHVSIHTKKSDYGRIFDTHPTVVVAPHWGAYNYMSREEREHRQETVKAALEQSYRRTNRPS